MKFMTLDIIMVFILGVLVNECYHRSIKPQWKAWRARRNRVKQAYRNQ